MLGNSARAVSVHKAAKVDRLPEEARETTAARETEEDVAGYLFDLLLGARRLAVTRRHRFLAYLIGVAAEEARLLMQGRSAMRTAAPSKSNT